MRFLGAFSDLLQSDVVYIHWSACYLVYSLFIDKYSEASDCKMY